MNGMEVPAWPFVLLPSMWTARFSLRTREFCRASKTRCSWRSITGIQLVLSTGRSAGECWYVLEQLPQIRYAVTYTGSMVQDLKTGAVLYHCPLQADDLRIIYDRLRQYDGLWSLFADGEVYNPRAQMAQFGRYYPEELRELFEHSHTYIDDMDRLIAETDRAGREGLYLLLQQGRERTRKSGCGEASVLRDRRGLCRSGGHEPRDEQGACAGRAGRSARHCRRAKSLPSATAATTRRCWPYAGVGVAMANGEEELKKIADRIAPSNEAGGVADILEMAVRGDL